MKIVISSITAINGGSEVIIRVQLQGEEHIDTRELVIDTKQYAALRPEKGEIDEFAFDTLEEASDLNSAIKRGAYILGYGACSEKNMTLKLRSKGFSKEIAASAASELVSRGYINEAADAVREAEKSVKKLWGARRIIASLYEKGYSKEAIDAASKKLASIDFSNSCATLIKKRLGDLPEDTNERKKLYARLARYGYSSSEIKAAFEQIIRENN